MGLAASEAIDRRPILNPLSGDYEQAMRNLFWIARQYKLLGINGGKSKEALFGLYFLAGRLETTTPELSLDARLVSLTDEMVKALGKYGSFKLTGRGPLLEPTKTDAHVALNSAFCDHYDHRSPLTVWDLCPKGDPDKPDMHLVAIKREGRKGHMLQERNEPWAIGWVTENEFVDLVGVYIPQGLFLEAKK